MKVVEHPIEWYVEKINKNEPFSICTMGDGEFIAAFGQHVGGENAEATVYSQELCDQMRESFKFKAENFYFSAPAGLKDAGLTGIGEVRIDRFLNDIGADIEFHEMEIWDQAMKAGNFGGFIKALRAKNVCVISNQALRLLTPLKYDKFIEIGYPNCFLEVDRVVQEVLEYGKPGVYLIAMGIPAVLVAQRLHGKIKDSWFIDIGSVWDTFVGIGRQRGFRAELYADHNKYAKWWRNILSSLADAYDRNEKS